MTSHRDTILAKLRRACTGQGTLQTSPQPHAIATGTLDTFCAKAQATGTQVIRVAGPAQAAKALQDLLAELQATTAACWTHPLLESLGVDALLNDAGVSLVSGTDGLAQADLGITATHGVLAESGSVLVAASPDTPRATSLLPPVHVAFVSPQCVLAEIADLAPHMRSLADESGRLPSGMHIITGPSSTGDIEMVVVKGAHGPVRCIFIVLDSLD